MQIENFDIEGYRSLRDLGAKLSQLTVLVGPNGVGKSNLYRALELLKLACDSQLARAIAAEGGISHVVWAGQRARNKQKVVRVNVQWEELEYQIVIGVTQNTGLTEFPEDPYIKTENIWSRVGKRVEMVRRAGPVLKYRDDEGLWRTYPPNLAVNESMLSQLREPRKFPICLHVRNMITGWRFYHNFRTDMESPLRQPQPVYRTGSMDSDASNMTAAIMSILDGKNQNHFREIVSSAFPNSTLSIQGSPKNTRREVGMSIPSLRSFNGVELSDGTLRFYALAAALLAEKPPEFLVLNEPETSLHPSTFGSLADAIKFASGRSQVLVVTHSRELAREIDKRVSVPIRTLRWDPKRGTRIDTQLRIDEPEHDEDFLAPGDNDDPYDEELNDE